MKPPPCAGVFLPTMKGKDMPLDDPAREINMSWEGNHALSFEVVFYSGKKKYFHFDKNSEGFSHYVLAEQGDTFNERPLFQMTVTYKTKVETAIPKCLQALRRRYMELRWDDPGYDPKAPKRVHV